MQKQKHRIISLLLAAVLLIPTNVSAYADGAASKDPPADTARVERLSSSGPEALEAEDAIDPDEVVTAIVTLETQPQVTAVNGSRQVRNQAQMLRQQKSVQKEISAKVLGGGELEILHSYTTVSNGFAVKVPYGKLAEIRALDGVAAAYPAPVFQLAPDMPTSTTELGGLANTSGYQGEGMVIAIVDSGLEISHQLFRDAPTSPALTQKDVENVLANKNLKAEEKKPGITASQVYHSAKVPFAFDYADKDLDVTPGNAGDHGTHVTGIAAGNAGVAADVVGVAPQAQILAMKVFSSFGSAGATWDDILAAADDAVALGADVINMSLGATCGFSTPEGDEEVAAVFTSIAASGVMLSISAGNEYSAALGTRIGKGHALTDNPDYGTVASPSSYSQPLSIASVEKAETIDSFYFTVGERKVAYNDTVEDKTVDGVTDDSPSFRSLAGQERTYVVVPNFGESKDYEGLDVTGKIALVSRGSVNYEVKKAAAKAAGAAGIVVYNNEPGMVYMAMDSYDLPSAAISQADGKYLVALAEGERKLTVSAVSGKVENPTSGEMSDFSSWGVTPELTLKPDITAPGGNIKSATVNNGYTTKSGTSMAAPFASGAMAIVKQYVEQKNLAESETGKAALVSSLLMSTADLVMAGDAPYSPRKQGAGSVNIAAATSADAYLTAVGGGLPKVELGDDPARSGSYTVKFEVHNLTDAALTYTVGGYIQADGQEVTKQLGGEDVHQVTELPYLLGRIGAKTVEVPASGSVTVEVPVVLTDANKQYLNTFKYGTYAEGFVTLTPEFEVQPVLSLPYMGFYGDWTEAPIVDAGDYSDLLNGKDSWAQAYVNTAATNSLENTVNTYLGDNPYHDGVAYLADRNAISPNNDDYMDSLSFVYTGLLRNAKALHYEIKDATTAEVYYDYTVDYETKSVYDSNYYQIVPSGVSDYSKFDAWYGTKKDGYSKLKNNDKVIVTVSAELSYDAHAANNAKSSWSFPVTIDLEEPEAKDITVRVENGKYFVDLTVTDNQFVSNITITNNAESKELASFPVAETEAGAETKCSYDITGFGENLKVVVNDYACNRKVYSFKAEGNVDDSEVIVPTKTILTEDFEETSFPPEGWTLQSQAVKTWYQGTEYGSKMAMCDLSKTEQQNEWLISPAIDLSTQDTKAGIVFDFYTNYYWSVQNHHHNLKVMASTDNGANWEQIWQLWDWNQKNEFGAWEKTQAKVTIPDKFQDAGSVKFAFVYEGKDSTSLWLDNIQVYVEDPSMIHTITATAGEGGTIDPSGAVQITDGKSRTFTITADEGYFLSDVKVDGESIGPKASYTFTNVKADHSIAAEFTAKAGGEKVVLLEEDFQNCTKGGAFPDGWTLESTNSNSTWTVYEYYYADKTLTASCGDDYTSYAKQDERLITPVLDMSNGGGAVSFRYIGGKTPTINGDYTVKLEASTDGSNWTTIWTSTELKNAAYDEIGYGGNTLSANVAVNIPAELQSATTKLAFRYERPAGENSGRGAVDDIRVSANTASSGGEESTLLDEDFNDCTSGGALPDGWSQVKTNSSYSWKVYKYYNQMGAYCDADAYDPDDGGWGWSLSNGEPERKNGDKQDERLITPALNMAGKTGTLSFQFTGNATLLKNGKMTVTLEGSTDDGVTWTEIWNAKNSVDDLKTGVLSDYAYTADITVAIPEALRADGMKLSFRYQRPAYSQDGGPVFVDNVKLVAVGGGATPVEPTEFTITASAGQGGSISPSGAVTVQKGESQIFTITASEGYEIGDVKVDGVSVGAVSSYTFESVTEAHTIAATFTEKAVTLPDSIHEDFNSGDELPEGWTLDGISQYYETWKIGKYSALNRSNVALCSQNVMFAQAQSEKLILPQIQMAESMLLSFDFGGSYNELSTGSIQFTVKATLNKGQTWTVLWDAKDHLPQVDEDSTVEDITGKGSVSIPEAFCSAEAQFAFVFESTERRSGTVAVDNVVFQQGSTPEPGQRHSITIAEMVNGTVTADKATAVAGETVTLAVSPDEGYRLKSGSLMAGDQVLSGNTFTMPDQDVTVTALFEEVPVIPDTGSYKDGVYTGSAVGHGGTVTVQVTVTNGKIALVEVLEQTETASYWQKALVMLERFLGLGNDEAVAAVDTKTGATVSSEAIKAAVQNALKDAKQEDSGIFDGGSGIQQSPYLIESVETLRAFAKAVNDGKNYENQFVALGCDLDLTDVAWTPIGTSDHGKTTGFAGTFDGRGCTVSHITCGKAGAAVSYEAIGFFGVVDGGTVKNLNVQVEKFYNTYDAYEVSMGGIAGILASNAVIDHCAVTGPDFALSDEGDVEKAVGGLVGRMESGSLIANSWSDIYISAGSLFAQDTEINVGGICGQQADNSLIANSASFGSVVATVMTGKLRVGGLVGHTSGALYNCYTTSTTKATLWGPDFKADDAAATTAIGHLIGSSATGAALYDCYYDKNADQFSNSDMAGDPEEGKEERRQATGWDNDGGIKTDESFIEAKTASELTSDDFAAVLNGNTKNSVKNAASDYFKSNVLLTDAIPTWEDELDDGFLTWKLTDGRVLFGDEAVERVTVEFVELLEQQTVSLGTSQAELNLPATVEVTLSDRSKVNLPVSWACENYDPNTEGSYTFVGTLTLSAGITNPKSLKAYLVVNVVSGETPEDTYQLTVIGGSGSGRYAPGTSVTVTADAPASGKVFDGWTAVGVTLADPSASTVTFPMPAGNVTLTAKWRSSGSSGGGESGGTGGAESGETYRVILPVYTVNGTITADPTEAAKGGKVTLTVTPANGYTLDALMVLDADGNALALSKQGGKFTFTMPGSDVTVKAVFAPSGIFTDVPAGSAYEDAIQWAVKNGITNGYGNGLFGTNDPCTRGQIVTFLWRAAGCPQPKMTLNPFRDVAAGDYCYTAVIWAVENGITNGIGDGLFGPDQTCTRAQSVTFLYRAAGSPAVSGSSFRDVPASAFCAAAVEWAVKNGITNGTSEGIFSPNAVCTRGQIVTFLYRQYQGK